MDKHFSLPCKPKRLRFLGITSCILLLVWPALAFRFSGSPLEKNNYFSDEYALLQEELDGSFYTLQNKKVYFRYEEKYDPASVPLTYKVYNYKHVALNTTAVLTKKLGTNFLILDLAGLVETSAESFYILEVTNSKDQLFYLRLRYIP